MRVLRLARCRASGGAEWLLRTLSHGRCAIAPRCSTQPQAQRSGIPIGRRLSFRAEVGADPGRLRIAFTTKPWNLHEVDSECVDAVGEAAKLCEDLGHYVEESSPEIDQAALGKATWVITTAQTLARLPFVEKVLGRPVTTEDFEPVTWAYLETALQFSASDYAEAINVLHLTGRVVGRSSPVTISC